MTHLQLCRMEYQRKARCPTWQTYGGQEGHFIRLSNFKCNSLHSYFIFQISNAICFIRISFFEFRISNAIRFIRISFFVSRLRFALFVFRFSIAIRFIRISFFECDSFHLYFVFRMRFASFVFRRQFASFVFQMRFASLVFRMRNTNEVSFPATVQTNLQSIALAGKQAGSCCSSYGIDHACTHPQTHEPIASFLAQKQ